MVQESMRAWFDSLLLPIPHHVGRVDPVVCVPSVIMDNRKHSMLASNKRAPNAVWYTDKLLWQCRVAIHV